MFMALPWGIIGAEYHCPMAPMPRKRRPSCGFGIGAILLLALELAAGCHRSKGPEQAVEIAGLHVTVWSVDDGNQVKKPVIIFSHGLHGCSTQSRFLMRAFARAGYLVFAPNHADASCNGDTASQTEPTAWPLGQPERWTTASYRDRADDLRRLIAAIGEDPRFAARADVTRLGLVGHSLGGYSVLGLSGAWADWRLDGVKAVLALSPYSKPFTEHHTLAGLTVPVMYQGGTKDSRITPALRNPDGAYEQSPEPKYYVEFIDAGHFAWTDLNRAQHEAIVAYSLAFMDHYLRQEPAQPILTRPASQVASLRFASELGDSDLKAAR
jgi:predicted dienelactone hydrolase